MEFQTGLYYIRIYFLLALTVLHKLIPLRNQLRFATLTEKSSTEVECSALVIHMDLLQMKTQSLVYKLTPLFQNFTVGIFILAYHKIC